MVEKTMDGGCGRKIRLLGRDDPPNPFTTSPQGSKLHYEQDSREHLADLPTPSGKRAETGICRTAQDVQQQGERSLRALCENLPGLVYRIFLQENHRVQLFNRKLAPLIGCSLPDHRVFRVHPLIDFIFLSDRPRLDAALAGASQDSSSFELEYRLRHGSQEVHCVLDRGWPVPGPDGRPLYIDGIITDISKQKQLENQLLHSQKMETVGRLAGSVAHDFNNILTTILGYGELLLREVPKDDPIREKILVIQDAGGKAASLAKQLLAFSRRQDKVIAPVDLNAIVESFGKMFSRLIGKDIKIVLRVSKPVSNIMADPGQIEQILMNFAVNAKDALPDGGTITISTEEVFLVRSQADELEPGSYIVLTFADSGQGIPSAVQDRIFEPFFTTKGDGKGTGLGLATVYGIVSEHRGQIFVFSELGKGTTFKVYFPVAAKGRAKTFGNGNRIIPRGKETILVVDDEPMVRRIIGDFLTPLGYKILEATCGAEALAMGAIDNVDLLLTEVIMRDMNGRTLAELLRRQRPNMKIVYMTSGSEEGADRLRNSDAVGGVMLQKPLIPTALASTLRQVLDGLAGNDRN